MLRALAAAALAAVLSQALPPSSASWNVARGDVRVICPLTIGGSFEGKTTALTGSIARTENSDRFDGSLSVDLRTVDTGIRLRNEHLRTRYLETDKGSGFERAVLSDIRLAAASAATTGGRTTFTGTLQLHGVSHQVAGEAQLTRTGTDLRVGATFPVNLPAFGIEKPQYLGVGVREQVNVRVNFLASPAAVEPR
jgi:polyisoprenoid-binding protein YceI